MSDIAIYLGYLVLYAILHSLLATEAVKQTASRRLGRAYAGYRFVYVVLSVGLLLPLLWLPEPEGIGYTVEGLPALGLRTIQGTAIVGFIWTLRHFDNGRFLGLTQLRTDRNSNENDVPFSTAGPFRWCRHPLYFFTSLLLLANPSVSTAYAVFSLWAVAYFYLGSFLEERRLRTEFGDAYARYQETTPRLLPRPPRNE